MALFLGLMLGAGLFLVWWSFWPRGDKPVVIRRDSNLRQLLARAGVEQVGPAGVVAAMIGCGMVALLLVFILTRALPIALCFGLFGALVPLALRAFRLDPALGSVVLVTTVTDTAGFGFVLGLAAWWLS